MPEVVSLHSKGTELLFPVTRHNSNLFFSRLNGRIVQIEDFSGTSQ